MGEQMVKRQRLRGLATLVAGVAFGATAAPLLADAAMAPSRVAIDDATMTVIGEEPPNVPDGALELALGADAEPVFELAPIAEPETIIDLAPLPTPGSSASITGPTAGSPSEDAPAEPTPVPPASPDEVGELASGPTEGGPVLSPDQLRADGADDQVEVEVFGAAIPAPPEVGASTTTETVIVESDPWAPVRECESSGNYSINTGNGYFGAYQFTRRTWDWVVGAIGREDLVGVRPNQATPADQDRAAEALAFELPGGGLHHWPVCGRLYGR